MSGDVQAAAEGLTDGLGLAETTGGVCGLLVGVTPESKEAPHEVKKRTASASMGRTKPVLRIRRGPILTCSCFRARRKVSAALTRQSSYKREGSGPVVAVAGRADVALGVDGQVTEWADGAPALNHL